MVSLVCRLPWETNSGIKKCLRFGAGAMGGMYKARHNRLDRIVVVKV